MLRAATTASASIRKPLTKRPSLSQMVPIDVGGGSEATRRPKPAAANAHVSSSSAADALTRSSPGFCGSLSGNKNS